VHAAQIPGGNRAMLIITRRPGERVMIGDNVVISIIDVKGSSVRIGIDAPREVLVYREEILEAMKADRAKAVVPPGAPTG
jgi:carbon storage regulator